MSTTIPNPDGNDFDFGDPEFWEYHRLDPDIAIAIAEGFPEYWLDVAGWYDPKNPCSIADKLAAKRREDNLRDLARESIAGTTFKTHDPQAAQKQPYGWMEPHAEVWTQYLAKHYPEKYREREWVETDRPYEQLFNQTVRQGQAVSLDDWQKVAQRLADQLEETRRVNRRTPKGLKRRERLDDGAQFVDRARLGRQDVLEDLGETADASPIRWGPLTYRDEHAFNAHYLVVGVSGSGKTTILRLLAQSLHNRSDCRMVVYDHKPDLIPFLTPDPKRSTTEFFYLFNPYDARSIAWNIAADVTPNSAATLAAILIPPGKHEEKDYFTRTPRKILATAVRALIARARSVGKNWTFLHLMLAIHPSNLRCVLSTTSEGCHRYETDIRGDQQTQQNVRSELDDCSNRYLRIAAAWHRASESLSLTQWAHSGSDRKGIILGNYEPVHDEIQPLNQAILHVLSRTLVDQSRPMTFRTFLILDEFEQLGRIRGLARTIHTARTQKLNLVFGVHDFDTLKKHYGEDTFGILSECGFKAFLRVENPSVAEWLSWKIGDQGIYIHQTSTSLAESQSSATHRERKTTSHEFDNQSWNPDDADDRSQSTGKTHTTTRSKHYLQRRAVPPEHLMALSPPSAAAGLDGYFQGPPYPVFYRGHMDPSVLYADRSWSTQNQGSLWKQGRDEKFQMRDESDFEPPEDFFEPLGELGFERDDKPHTAPLRAVARSAPPTSPHIDNAPSQTEKPISPENIDISDMPKRVRWRRDQQL